MRRLLDSIGLWYINLYPGGKRKRDIPFDLCHSKGIIAIGWSKLNQQVKTDSAKQYRDGGRAIFQRVYDSGETGLQKFLKQFGNLSKMKRGDLVWTKRSREHYYLNRVTDTKVMPLYGKEFEINDFGSARSSEWHEVPDELDVPADVTRNIRGTIHPVKDPNRKALAVSEILYNEIKGEKVYHPPKLKRDLFHFLAPEDVEDLVGLYLQVIEKLVVIPSTSKKSTSPVEFLMISRETGEEAGVQVKTGDQAISLNNYKDPITYYFFQENGKPKGVPASNHIFITKKQLLDFANDNLGLLPKGIRRLVERLT